MRNPKQRGTNAADSAPGVDDGAARNAEPQHMTKPGGRLGVWLWILIALVILAAIFMARPLTPSRGGQFIGTGTTAGEIAGSQTPGAQPTSPPQR